MKATIRFPVILGWVLACGTVFGGEAGAPIDVAPKVEGTQVQLWPRAAWAADSKSWLVVWREGYVNDEATDVWCARVSADGKALDPAGIKVCAAKDRQERAVVASDGKGWLLVWEDFRNGKDYDVYAARVSAEGKVLDPEGFLVAGGEHNQCYPAAAFAGGNYVVVWQSYCGDYPDGTVKDGIKSGYRLFGTTVSPDGKVATPGGAVLSPTNMWHTLRPAAAAAGDSQHAVVWIKVAQPGPGHAQAETTATLWIDGASGKAEARYTEIKGNDNRKGDCLDGGPLAVAWGKEGGLALAKRSEALEEITAWRLDATGARVLPEIGAIRGHQEGFNPMYSVASDGEQYLVTRDRVVKQKPMTMLGVQARLLPADWKGDGKLDESFFLVAGDGSKSCLMGQAAAGPKGTFLVTYVEARGAEDIKILARIVK